MAWRQFIPATGPGRPRRRPPSGQVLEAVRKNRGSGRVLWGMEVLVAMLALVVCWAVVFAINK
jgi:hypothetical protein